MKFQVINSLREFDSFRDKYDQIFSVCSNDLTPYQSFGWNYFYSKYFSGNNILNLCLLDEPEIKAILPMWRKDYNGPKALEFIGARGTDYLNFITTNKEKLADMLLDYFIQNQNLDIIYLEDITETESIIEWLESKCSEKGLYFQKIENCPVFFIKLPKTSDLYLNSLSKRTANDFHYDIRYAEKHLRVKLEYIVEKDEKALLEHIKLHQKIRENKNTKGSYYKKEISDFMMDFIQTISPDNRRISFLKIDGNPIASILSVVHNNKVFLVTVGFDPEYQKYTPGKILFIKDILNCIEFGYKHYDLSRGAEDYKTKLGAIQKNNLCIYISKDNISEDFKKAYQLVKDGVGHNPDL